METGVPGEVRPDEPRGVLIPPETDALVTSGHAFISQPRNRSPPHEHFPDIHMSAHRRHVEWRTRRCRI